MVTVALLLAACSSQSSGTAGGTGGAPATSSTSTGTGAGLGAGGPGDAGADAPYDAEQVPVPDGSIANPCDLPGTVQFTASGTVLVPGGSTTAPSLDFLHLPVGFCAHYYGTVGDARQLRFSPGNDLFVASPTGLTTGGNANAGGSSIVILPDDDMDGNADSNITFLNSLPETQGLLFANSFFYYQDGTKIMRVPYTAGDRAPGAASEQVADLSLDGQYQSGLHWPKAMDMADDGTIYVGNGGDQGESCVTPHPFHGGIYSIDPAPGGPNPAGTQVAQGFRNPIAVRCLKGHNTCFALELAKDYTAASGGREKMVEIHKGDDWGFPCCATANVAYPDAMPAPPAGSCAGVAQETNSFLIGDTPFGLDFEMNHWSGPFAGRAFVATHGAAGSYLGARIVAIPVDPTTGLPSASTDISGSQEGADVGMLDFATGWYVSTVVQQVSGRPSALAFHPDGRLFVANDNNGMIFWVAQMAQ